MCGTSSAASEICASCVQAGGRACFPSLLRQPVPVCLRTLRSRLRRLLAALGALRSPRGAANPQSGFAFNVYSRTLIINPNASTKAGCIIVAARFIAREKRFIARTLLSRQGWERLCGAGVDVFFAAATGARSARDHGDGIAKTNAPKPHSSGQPDGAT